MDAISSLPRLNELLSQNTNIRPANLGQGFGGEMASSAGVRPPSVPNVQGVKGQGIQPIDATAFTNRVTAPGFAEMFQKFVKGVDQKKKASAQETQDLILGRSDNIHEAVVKSEESKVAFNLMIEVRNKLVDSYKELMRMQV